MKRLFLITSILISILISRHSPAQAEGTVPRFEVAECPITVPEDRTIECGYLTTLEDYDNPEGQTIRTAVLIIHSKKTNTSREALLFTEGGPGFSSLNSVWWLSRTEFGEQRDIVILEQRGNKYSEPRLDCDFSVWWDEKEGHTPCLDSLNQQGINLKHYTTTVIAADINTLMQVLDYKTWDLYGTSYSTRPYQYILANYPEDIRSVVLHSIAPITESRFQHDPEHSARVLKVMFDDCKEDPACSQAYPDLENQFHNLVRKLNAEPIEIEMDYPGSSEKFTYEVTGKTLIGFMVEGAFYGPAYPGFDTAYLPLLINKVSEGNTELLYPWAEAVVSKWGNDAFSWGLYFSINCQEEAPSISQEILNAQSAMYPELDGFLRHDGELAVCNAWGLAPAPPLATEPVTSDIPVLALAGTYDPITPPEWSRTAIENLSNSTFIEFPAAGHSVVSNNPCAQQLSAAFLDNPFAEPDLSCMTKSPRPQFVLPDEIIIAPSMYEIHYIEIGNSKLEEGLFLGSWLTLLGTGIVALIAGLVKLIRHNRVDKSDIWMRITLVLLIILPISASVWGFQLRASLQSTAATASNILRFGLPRAYGWLFAVVPLIGIMTIGLFILTALAWKRKSWSLIDRIALTISTLAAITFSGVLAYWGLFTPLFT